MTTNTPLTPWTKEELKAHAYVTAQQLRTPSNWDDEPWDDLFQASLAAAFQKTGRILDDEPWDDLFQAALAAAFKKAGRILAGVPA